MFKLWLPFEGGPQLDVKSETQTFSVEPDTMTVPIWFIARLYMESLFPLREEAGTNKTSLNIQINASFGMSTTIVYV